MRIMEIGKLIQEERERRGLSYNQLAIKVGCTGRAISYWETGQRVPSIEMADKVLAALDITLQIGKKRKEDKPC